ncbi:MAG: hypothetical protein H5T59_04755 [Anaerolineae bacterium]|nr:hypothetical protein [Anaerolineae bacterium]
MSRRLTRILILLSLALAGLLFWNKVRIVFWMHLNVWQLLLLFLAVAFVLFLLLDLLVDVVAGRRRL